MTTPLAAKTPGFVEEIELQGHIIDSLLLPKVLDEILTRGGSYVVKDIRIGQRQTDPSYARLEVRAGSGQLLEDILAAIHDHGMTTATRANKAGTPTKRSRNTSTLSALVMASYPPSCHFTPWSRPQPLPKKSCA